MKRLLLSTLLAAFASSTLFLAGCKSTPEEETPAPVTDATPQPVKPAPAEPIGRPTDQSPRGTALADPTEDPNSILSKRSVFFDFDSNAVKDEYKPMITAHAKYVRESGRKVVVQGNTDERGSREYNIALGQRRADAVKQMMLLLGAQEGQLESVSFGKEKPRNPGHDEAAWAENRRADIVYDGK
jgi:peptidoglycan-associated lipoprotein